MSLPASELPDTAPPLDRFLGHVPEDERAAERCPLTLPQFASPPQSPTLSPQSSPPPPPLQSPLPPQSERYDVESH